MVDKRHVRSDMRMDSDKRQPRRESEREKCYEWERVNDTGFFCQGRERRGGRY